MGKGRPSDRTRTNFGKRLYEVRMARGFTQEDIAELFSITPQAYARWERYSVGLKPEQIEKLVKKLNVSAEFLFGQSKDLSPFK